MLLSGVYEPKDDELIYHYCGASAFLEICMSKNLRLSDLFSMNDFMEMHWGYSIWETAAGQVLSEIGKDFLDKIDEVIHFSGYHRKPSINNKRSPYKHSTRAAWGPATGGRNSVFCRP